MRYVLFCSALCLSVLATVVLLPVLWGVPLAVSALLGLAVGCAALGLPVVVQAVTYWRTPGWERVAG